MRITIPCRAAAGFTLIELVVSASIMALILSSAYLCLHACLSAQKLIDPRIEIVQNARVAMSLMAADLRGACPLAKDSQFIGMHRMLGDVEADNLDFGTHNYTPQRAAEGDYCQISYFLERNRQSNQFILWRRRNPTIGLDPLSGGHREEIAKGLRGLKFEYYDGLEWYDSWGDSEGRGKEQSSWRTQPNLSGMPDAVRITLWFDSNPRSIQGVSTNASSSEPPLVFQSVARLNLAGRFLGSSSSGSSSGGAAPANNTGTQGGP